MSPENQNEQKQVKRKKVTGFYLKPNTVRLLGVVAAVEGKSMSEVIETAFINSVFNPSDQLFPEKKLENQVDNLVSRIRGKLSQSTIP